MIAPPELGAERTVAIGSLFSGIGGLELGLEWAGLGPVIWQVEKDPFCRAVLAKHYPEAKRFDDVCTVGATELGSVDLICGGFPCQDLSSAGKRTGLTGSRSGLWREFARIIAELRPAWVLVENVRSGATNWVDAIVRGLEELRYACFPIPLSAGDVGAPHERARVFVVAANTDGVAQRLQSRRPSGAKRSCSAFAANDCAPCALAHVDGQQERQPDNEAEAERNGWARSRTDAERRAWWGSEPDVGRVVHGVPDRLERLRLLGNSVVPQCAEVVGWVIRELIEAGRASTPSTTGAKP